MADVVVHLTGSTKREVEQALGRELKPTGPEGDLFRIPAAVAERIGEFPPSPPKAEDSRAVKDAVRALPLSEDAQNAKVEKTEPRDKDGAAVEDVTGPEIRAGVR